MPAATGSFMIRPTCRLLAAALLGLAGLAVPHRAAAGPGPGPTAASGDAAPQEQSESDDAQPRSGEDDEDLSLQLAQPDFSLIGLPTTLRVPRHESAFRVTHRFTRSVGQGDAASLLENLFGLDGGARIGLEYRFGLFHGTQIGIHRTSNRTIELFLQRELLAQRGGGSPVDVALLAAVEGTNNLRDEYSPVLGALVSRTVGDRAALYFEPLWIHNARPLILAAEDDRHTLLLGLGARVRVGRSAYVTAEFAPRVGYTPGVHHAAVGLEKRAGGHSFQLNVSNGFGTTPGQIAGGGVDSESWYLGFNISRKFFRTTGAPQARDDAGSAGVQEEDDPDLDTNPAQPDFTLVNLPTTLRVPRHKSAFRVTHRFARPLGAGSVGSLLEDFFGFDAGGLIGLEYRFGLFRGTQVGIHRTSDRTVQFFGQHDLVRQAEGWPVGLAVVATVDGTNNFRDSYSPGVGVVVSRAFGAAGAAYLVPMFVDNTNLLSGDAAEHDDTLLVGIGARFRISRTLYLVGEYNPRVAGYDARVHQASFGIEKRAGGHSFQLNFNNGFGTTWGQIARGGTGNEDWYIGFNISRKFF